MQIERLKNGIWESAGAITEAFEAISLTPALDEKRVKLRINIPIIDIQSYWIPKNRTPENRIPWVIESQSSAQCNFPFLAFLNSAQQNRCSIGLSNLKDDTLITAKMNQEKCQYEITITIAVTPETVPFEVVVNRRDQPWTRCLGDWRETLKLPLPTFPEAAWQPVFCSWYAVHAAVTQSWVEQNAQLASELGFGTLIIDDGWCFDEMKRVTPTTLTDWYELIGDWELSTQKFPDFANHVQRVRALGLNYMLWVTPILIGAKSKLYQEIKDSVSGDYHEGCYCFDPQHEAAGQVVIEKISRLMKDYYLDGLKIDFLDSVPTNPEQPRGQETHKFIAALSAAIRAHKSDALIEFRQSYATIGMLPFATQFRAGDVPFDFIDNFQRLAQIRMSLGDRVPVHADPAYWHPNETPENISRHLMASLVGVPMVSMDLNKLTKPEKTIITSWLAFYQKHLDTFKNGRWDINYHNGAVSWITVSTGKELVVFINDTWRLSEALDGFSDFRGPIILLNLTAEAMSSSALEGYDCLGNSTGKKISSGGLAYFSR